MTAALIAQLEALSQDKQRSAWDCANCGVEANLVEAVSNALRTATARAEALERERDEARGWAAGWHKVVETVCTVLDLGSLDADKTVEAVLAKFEQLSSAEARATAAETRNAELTRERDQARDQRDYWRGRDKAGLEIQTELEARNAELVEGLKPFAEFADALNEAIPDNIAVGIFADGATRFGPGHGTTLADLRRARSLIQKGNADAS